MKKELILSFGLLLCVDQAFGQGTCASAPVQSPIVPKPTDGAIIAATCSTLVVTWKGMPNQNYVVEGTARNPATNQTIPLVGAIPVATGTGETYTATIPVVAATYVSWNVQATQLLGGRTFTSYPLRGVRDYAVPSCPALPTEGMLYPNPVTTVLTVVLPNTSFARELKSAHKMLGANPMLSIFDVNGRRVILQPAPTQKLQIDVQQLRSGTYMVVVEDRLGTRIYMARFIKQ